MRQLSHLDGVIDNLAFTVEGKTRSCFVDWDNFQVDLRSESSIQFNLAAAKVVAFLHSAEIEKAEINWLLHFEDKRRRYEDP